MMIRSMVTISILIIACGGSFHSVLNYLKEIPNVKSVYLDRSNPNLKFSNADFKFPLGKRGGTAGNVFDGYAEFATQRHYLFQILNKIVYKIGRPDLTMLLTGVCPASTLTAATISLIETLKAHPAFIDVPIIPMAIIDLQKVTTEEMWYKTFTSLTYLSDISDSVFLFNNSFTGFYTEESEKNPYYVQNMKISQILADLASSTPFEGDNEDIKDKIWEEVFGEEPTRSKDRRQEKISGKFLDLKDDITALMSDPWNSNWTLISNFHCKKVENSYDIISRSLANISAPLIGYPLIGNIGVGLCLGNMPYFNDLTDIVKREICEKAFCRLFSYRERHAQKGALMFLSGVEWQNITDLVELKEKAVDYAERYAEKLILDSYQRASRKLIDGKTQKAERKTRDEFKRGVEIALALRYKKKEQVAGKILLNDLSENLRLRLQRLMEKRTNNLSKIFEKETGLPNPFKVLSLEGEGL